jgi:2-oxoglutarate ferredoxin oxidoreductase subunit beta
MPKDLASDQEVRWCPGCGDFSILAQLKKVLASLDVPRERLVFVSGVGCASRLPYYLNTYGFHTIRGRAPAIATGLTLARPDLSVWVITGDGDGMGPGLGHLLHAIRRNVDLKILLFNNETSGLSRGQYSPTSRVGTLSRSSPQGSIDRPLRPLSLALAADATFAARTVDVDVTHLGEVLQRAAVHRGTAFVEIYQNCKIFNDGVFEHATDKSTKPEGVLYLEHAKPLLFGTDQTRGLRLTGLKPEIVELGNGTPPGDLLVHDEHAAEPDLACLLSRLLYPDFPECLGVFRSIERPSYNDLVEAQEDEVRRQRGPGALQKLLDGDDGWEVGDTTNSQPPNSKVQ